MRDPAAPKPRLGPRSLMFFWGVMAFGLLLQTGAEMLSKGLGSGVAPAMTAMFSVPVGAIPTAGLLFVGLIYQGLELAGRAVAYALALHGGLCGWLWLTLSTPMASDHYTYNWLDKHPDVAGIGLMAASLAGGVALYAGSRRARGRSPTARSGEDR